MELAHDLNCDRRSQPRSIRTLKPVFVETEDTALVALMQDISTTGAGLAVTAPLRIGQDVRYRWGTRPFQTGRVIWVQNGRVGIANDCELLPDDLIEPNYRSVRVPLSAPATVFVGGKRLDAEILNVAQSGVSALTSQAVPSGALATIKIGRRYFEGATAKWTDKEQTGFRLARALPVSEMSNLLVGQ
jgi:hypothetical protein